MAWHKRTAALAALAALPAIGADNAATASAALVDASGATVGEAHLEQVPKGVILRVEAAALPPGPHGIHLHGVGSCAPDFTAAKGHVNPASAPHGLRHPDGPDPGDLPNLFVAADGSARAEFYTTRVALAPGRGAAAPLLDADGAAVIIHANADDHMSQPIGGAGGRIACGVIAAGQPAGQPPAASSP